MLSFLKPRTQAAGFTLKDDDIAQEYIDRVNKNDQAGADAVLAEHGWTVGRVTKVLDHFDPEKVYTDTEMAAARAALALFGAGQEKEARKLLKKQRLDESDMSPAVDQYWSALDTDDDDEADVPEASEPVRAPGNVERTVIPVPAGYKDSLEERGKLIAALWRKLGDGWQVESFDAARSAVVVVRGSSPALRPGEMIVPRATDHRPTDGPKLASYLSAKGMSLVEYHPFDGSAVAAALPPATIELRARIAESLRIDPWESKSGLEFRLEFGRLGEKFGITKIVVHRFPITGPADKRRDMWLEQVHSLVAPLARTKWRYEDQLATTGHLVLTRILDPLLQVLPYPKDSVPTYESIPFGVNEDLNPVSLGLLEMNQLLGGLPGGGKSGGITTLLAGISRLENVALVGLDPKKVEMSLWKPRFSRIATHEDDATDVLTSLVEEMERRYTWLEMKGLKKLTPGLLSPSRPLIVLVIDELADLVSTGVSPDEKKGDAERAGRIRRVIAKGRAAGIVVIAATQKPQSDVVPTALRDLIQLRVAYATTNVDMTDTILGKGMGQLGGLAHEIPAYLRGACYVISESSRTPIRARTYWVPDEDVAGLAKSTAHLRINLPWLDGGALPSAPSSVVELGEMELELGDLDFDDEPVTTEAVQVPELDWKDDFDAETPLTAVPLSDDIDWDDTPATPAAAVSQEDPFADEPKATARFVQDDDDPFGEPTPTPAKPKPKVDDFEW